MRVMTTSRRILLLVALFYVGIFGAGSAVGAESVEEQIRRIAAETQKSLPMQVSEDVVATNVAAVGKTMMYRYNFTKKLGSLSNTSSLKSDFYRSSLNSACTNPVSINALKQGVSYLYEFYDSENKFVMQFSIDRGSCRK